MVPVVQGKMRTFFGFVLLVAVYRTSASDYFRKLQSSHKLRELRNAELHQLSQLSDTRHINRVLDNILIPRVVGTKGHQQVFDYITKELRDLDWDVQVDEFQDKTPNFGALTFKNIIARLNPSAERYLTLACHYDSKYFAEEEFVGATDSAVPCAMLLNLAKTLKPYLNSTQSQLSLQLIFFDGEEAFVNWGPNDSIYGAKHLANKFHGNRQLHRASGETISDLHRIDMLILLDLIGHSRPSFFSFFPDTQKWYIRMTNIEDRLRQQRLLNQPAHVYFKKAAHYGKIEDDHIPFLNKGVPILHLISTPFPNEWHTPDDNRSIVDIEATEDVQKILTAFVVEYLHIDLDELDADTANIPDKEL